MAMCLNGFNLQKYRQLVAVHQNSFFPRLPEVKDNQINQMEIRVCLCMHAVVNDQSKETIRKIEIYKFFEENFAIEMEENINICRSFGCILFMQFGFSGCFRANGSVLRPYIAIFHNCFGENCTQKMNGWLSAMSSEASSK